MLSLLFFFCITINAYAQNVCTQNIQRVERLEGIPKDLLLAMARAESGKWNAITGTIEPWPWTVQAKGKSHYFDSKRAALGHVVSLQRKGIKNIDVGCMQVNVGHHRQHFQSISHMLDPAANVSYAGKYLRHLRRDGQTAWPVAVGNYHSRTGPQHLRYQDLVHQQFKGVQREAERDRHFRSYTPPTPKNRSAVHAGGISLYSYERTYGAGVSKRLLQGRQIIVPSKKK